MTQAWPASWAAVLAWALCGCSSSGADPASTRGQWLFYAPAGPVQQVSVVGDFNLWDPAALPMARDPADGIFRAFLELGPGRHHYRIFVDGQTELDRYNPLTLFDARGQENSILEIPDLRAPTLSVERLEARADGALAVDLRFLRGATESAPDWDSVEVSLSPESPLQVVVDRAQESISISAAALAPGKYRLRVAMGDGRRLATGTLTLPFWVEEQAFDWRDAIIYQVVIDRFRRGGGELDDQASLSFYRGGDLAGLRAAIEEGYFASLGVNTLWISPMVDNPDGDFLGRDGYPAEAYHGYWPAAARSVEPRFGGGQALDALVKTAHEHGLRVIMDAVLNHLHRDHPYFAEHAGDGWFNHPKGDCVCGFTCSWGEYMESCWFDPFLPDLRHEKPEVVDQLVGDAIWWIDRFDLDGLRLDAVPMMPRLVLRHLRHRLAEGLERSGLPVYLLGETYTQQGGQDLIRYYLGPHTLSGQFDFPVMWALRSALLGQIGMTELDLEVRRSEQAWAGSGAVMGAFLGNHDVPRFVSVANGDAVHLPRTSPPPVPTAAKPYDLLRLAWTFVFSAPDAPVVYYGDEVGLAGGNDPDNRRNMPSEAALTDLQRAVRTHVQLLGQARACSPALRRGGRQTLLVGANLYALGRDAGDGYPAVAVLNPTTVERRVSLDLPADWSLAADAAFADLFDAPVEQAGHALTVDVPARSSALLLSSPGCIGVTP